MKYLRTSEDAFDGIGFDFTPQYTDVTAEDGTPLRMHYIDEGPECGEIMLCLHGQPSWSYLYRLVVEPLTAAGMRVIAPDLIGFGKSDKPTRIEDYSYSAHVDWIAEFIEQLGLSEINGLFQDWGGMIGMRLVARRPDIFRRVIVANTMLLDTSDIPPEVSAAIANEYARLPLTSADDVRDNFAANNPLAAAYWVKYATENPSFSVRDVFNKITGKQNQKVLNGYAAPFPDRSYLAGPLSFPGMFPIMPKHQADREENDRVWRHLSKFTKPVLTAFSDGDPVTRGHDRNFQDRIPGAENVEHVTIFGAGHYLQDEKPSQLTEAIIQFIADTE